VPARSNYTWLFSFGACHLDGREVHVLGDLELLVEAANELLKEKIVLQRLLLQGQQPLFECLALQHRLGRRLATLLAQH